MPVSLRNTDILFNDNSKMSTDPGRDITLNTLPKALQNTTGGTVDDSRYYLMHFAVPAISGRNTVFTSQYMVIPPSGPYGGYTYSSVGNAQLTVKNSSGSTLRLNVTSGIVDLTDDTSRWLLYRDGSIATASTHSGGTLLHDSGLVARSGSFNGGALNTFTQTNDIASGATATYTLYAGTGPGSGADGIAPYLQLSFNSWI